jgi:hypothetical protein
MVMVMQHPRKGVGLGFGLTYMEGWGVSRRCGAAGDDVGAMGAMGSMHA